MDLTISLLNYTFRFRIEILLLIVLMYFILTSHVLCSCATVTPMEAFTVAKTITEGVKNKLDKKLLKYT